MTTSRDLLTVTEAAAYLGVTRQAIHLLTKRGLGKRYGSVWLFTREELDAWRARPRTQGGRPPGAKDKIPKGNAGTLATVSPAVVKI
jgi:excisionase family DNA binding protein